jgi:hypothetical protein
MSLSEIRALRGRLELVPDQATSDSSASASTHAAKHPSP